MKYIIELEDEPMIANSFHQEVDELWKAKGFNSLVFDQNGIKKLTPYTEPDRNAIEDEVWEFAKKLISMSGNEVSDMMGCATNFGEVMHNMPYQEAKAKYEAWKKQNDDIHVGDEVEYECECDGIVRFVVTGFCGETAFGFKHPCDYDDVGEYRDIEDLRKTGRHFDEVEALLKKMRGKE